MVRDRPTGAIGPDLRVHVTARIPHTTSFLSLSIIDVELHTEHRGRSHLFHRNRLPTVLTLPRYSLGRAASA